MLRNTQNFMHKPESESVSSVAPPILDRLPVAILLIETDGSVLYRNVQAEKLLTDFPKLDNLTRLSNQFDEHSLAQAIASFQHHPEEPFTTLISVENHSLGETWQLDLTPYNGEKNCYLATLHKILTQTGLKNSALSIKTSEYALLKKNFKELKHFSRISAMREISSSLADQLNQPLTAILSYTQAMQRLYHNNASLEEIHDAMERVVVNAQTAGKIIRDIRATINANSLNCETVEINQLIEQSIQLTDLDSRSPPIRLTTQFDPQPSSLTVDPVQFKQVILSLLQNAIDAVSEPGIHQPCIRLTTHQDGLRYEITIEDNGPGIDKGIENKLFEPFFTTKENGIGIGLSMCHHIIDLHKGSITISKQNAATRQPGTVVTIHLPRNFHEAPANN